MIIRRIKRRIIAKIATFTAKIRHRYYRKHIKNTSVSIISQNCIGGVISHDLGLKFLSPTVNLYMNSHDFMLFVENLREFKDGKLQFIKSDKNYPVAICTLRNKSIKVHFVHYSSKEEAEKKWHERYERINYDNIHVVMTDRDGFNNETLERFKKLPYKKILFSSKKIRMEDVVYVKEFRKEYQVGDLIPYATLSGKRFYEKINIVKWLNE